MLRQVRTALKGVVAWFIIALLVLAFALWGVPELRNFTQRAPLRVGKVGFSAQDIVAEFNREMERRRLESGGQYSREQAIAAGLPDSVVSSLATRSVLEQEAARMGLAMPRAIVRDVLQADERFKNPATGTFDRVTLQSILASNGLTVRQFENLMREDLLRAQLVQALSAGGQAPAAMAEALALREDERRRVAYLTITDEMAGVPEEPTPDALKSYYDANAPQFMAPEYRTFVAAIVRLADFSDAASASDDELRKVYEANKARLYDQPEKRTLYQITYDDETQAQAAAATLRQGKPFENLASDRGLTLAQVTFNEAGKKDILDPSVAEAAFASERVEGDVAGPVKSLFGWTVVQLAAIIPAQTKSFAEVRAEIAAEVGKQETRKRLLEKIDEIEEARDTGAGLAAAAKTAGVALLGFGPIDSFSFAPGGAIVADVPGEVLAAAFKVQEGEESEALELADDGGYFFVQVDEVTPPAPLPFAEIVDEVADRWRADERRRRIDSTVKQVTDALAGGTSLEDAAAPFNRAVLEAVLSRGADMGAFSPALIDEVFKSAPQAVLTGAAGAGSAKTVAIVREIGYSHNHADSQQEEAFRQFLGYQLTQEHLDAYISALREDYGVRTDQAAIAQLFAGEQ